MNELQHLTVIAKRWWHSFTLWLNGILGVLMSLDIAGALDTLPTLQHYLTPTIYQAAFVALTIINILLRLYKTRAPIHRG